MERSPRRSVSRARPGRWLAPVPRTGSQLPFPAIELFGKTARWADIAGVSNAKKPCCRWSSRALSVGPPLRIDFEREASGEGNSRTCHSEHSRTCHPEHSKVCHSEHSKEPLKNSPIHRLSG